MRTVVVEHAKLQTEPSYRARLRPVLKRARNCRGQAGGVRVVVIHDDRCCTLQSYEATERAVLNVGVDRESSKTPAPPARRPTY